METQGKLSQWLKEKCKTEHLSLRQAGKRAGLSHSTVHIIMKGGHASAETVTRLARGFSGNGRQRQALEDHLLALAGYRTEQREDEGYLKLASLLSPGHQHVVEVLVGELAKIEGVVTSEKETRSNG